jgi:tRNA pseudouridine13 synthase
LFAEGLAAQRMDQERRPLRLRVADLTWRVEGGVLELSFTLPAGAFATAVLREVVEVD